jgi:hypothetical protein
MSAHRSSMSHTAKITSNKACLIYCY